MADDVLVAAPAAPAPPIPAYPQFAETVVPDGCAAARAYRGFIRPFSDDETAQRVLRAITADEPLQVSAGRLDSCAKNLPTHRFENYLVEMAVPCTVVVLEFPGTRHHSAYLLDPIQVPRFSANRHTWWKSTVVIDGKAIPELCVYAGNLFKYDPTCGRLPQFLNQLSTYLAKHLIFLRTRLLYRLHKNGTLQIVKRRKPWEPVRRGVPTLGDQLQWLGFWPGQAAPHGAAEHLRTVDPDGECWCNSGALYRDCHMNKEKG
jgi:SEC-C motif-containing protein